MQADHDFSQPNGSQSATGAKGDMASALTLHPLNHFFDEPVSQALQHVLVSTYKLYLTTHHYHWNVEGVDFFPLHKLFEEKYGQLFVAVDGIAERIRALNAYVMPFETDNIIQISQITYHPQSKESRASDRAEQMVRNLIML